MGEPLALLQRRVRELEADPGMHKGRLIDTILQERLLDWDALFRAMHIRGRHRSKMRWRRAIITDCIRRPFPRGGSRKARPAAPVPETAAPPLDEKPSIAQVPELSGFSPEQVWGRFRCVFPVTREQLNGCRCSLAQLAVYRAGWVAPTGGLADAVDPAPLGWELLWTAHAGRVPVAVIGRALGWPDSLTDISHLIPPLARRLWPHGMDDAAADDLLVPRGCLPYIRRTACLLHGFQLGGCAPRGVWEAIKLPSRLAI